ncbi:hypothetical protein CLU79DRAFT_770364 [Phycomyces nitens]|nr:hypothetical protein CLU79DRAFT_770364 [Phycomyces nitens]
MIILKEISRYKHYIFKTDSNLIVANRVISSLEKKSVYLAEIAKCKKDKPYCNIALHFIPKSKVIELKMLQSECQSGVYNRANLT